MSRERKAHPRFIPCLLSARKIYRADLGWYVLMTAGRAIVFLKQAIVAIPARNEEDRIVPCLRALSGQSGLRGNTLRTVVFVNGSNDRTAELVQSMSSGERLNIRLIEDREIRNPHAGWARRAAMEAASDWFGQGSTTECSKPLQVILTTDADTIVPLDWVTSNLCAIAAGASAVAGAFDIDPTEKRRLPVTLRWRLSLEARYEALMTELNCRLDPQAHDPWPRHAATSGASLAVELGAYRAVGGMPSIPVGEDRAFVEAIIATGRRVRHDPGIRVLTSGRLVGRAIGGFSDGMRLRAAHWNDPCDERLQPVERLFGPLTRSSKRRVLRPTDLPAEIAKASFVLAAMRTNQFLTTQGEAVARGAG